MSGIAGIVNLDGAPVDRTLLERMASFLGPWGPDASAVWASGSVGLVHTLLRATPESGRERQPASLDGKVWIAADARVDGREDLVAELRGRGRDCTTETTEPELLLHAYAAWGEACVEHLLGDFAFAIWDARNRKLFCARDHLGVKPFFYAQLGNALVFSNAIDCARLHPGFQWETYEPAIADYLVLGYNHDVTRTTVKSIRRLAPAHELIVQNGEVRTRRYWTLPIEPKTVFRHNRDYVDRFRELFEKAVRDRVRAKSVAVLMSGGLDSSSVAAMARHVSSRRIGGCHLSVHTQIYENLIPYNEGHYASLVARALGVPWREFALDNMRLLELWNRPEFRRAEPEKLPVFPWTLADSLGNPPAGTTVLTGHGGDSLFSSLRMRHCRQLLRQHRWYQLAKDLRQYLTAEGRLGRLYLRGHVRRYLGKAPPGRPFPAWISPDLCRRLNLQERYRRYEMAAAGSTAPTGAVRPEAYENFMQPLWPSIFGEHDPDAFGAPVDVRHPFFDVRLVRFALTLPALPWCADKEILRRSMRGLLPDEVRLRAKQPVLADYLLAHFRANPRPWLENLEPVPELAHYVDLDTARKCLQNPKEWELVVHLRPLYLNYWLKWESHFTHNLQGEEYRVPTDQSLLQ